jgi:HlyD family secretion protein
MKFRIPLPRLRPRAWITVGVLTVLLVVVGTATLLGAGSRAGDVMTIAAVSRPFVAMTVERGILKAADTVTYTAPRMRFSGGRGGQGGGMATGAQIIEMVPEGTLVETGDLIVKFDSSALQDALQEAEGDLEDAKAQLRKTLAQQDSRMAGLVASLEMTQFSFEKAKLNLQRMEFEAEVRRRQEELSFKKSELSLIRAQEAIDTQKRVDTASLERVNSRIAREQSDVDQMRRELEMTTLYAEQGGLVVYESNWGPEGQTKVKVGDTPYSGQTIISIPNLDRMIITLPISEMDIHLVARDQVAMVVVDAYPDTIYQATVTDVSPLARRMGFSQVKVFDCTVTLKETDLRLRPGMSAQISVITAYEPEAVQIPLEAVFRREGQSMVFLLDGSFREIPVELGPENRNFVVVREGLRAGVLVALRDPFEPLPSLESAGADALKERRTDAAGGNIIMQMGGRGGMSMRIFR